MKTLLRHTRTGLYFQGTDRWTSDPHSAYDFRFIDLAQQYASTWNLRDVELAFAFDDAQEVTMVSLDRAALQFAAA